MTPLQRACLEMGSCDDPVDMKLTRAVVTAYLQAIAEDAETVDRVAVEILGARNMKMKVLPPDAIWLAYPKGQAIAEARAALLTLSTISGGEKA